MRSGGGTRQARSCSGSSRCSQSITRSKIDLGQVSTRLPTLTDVTHYSPGELAAQLKTGLLSFPVTAFHADLSFNEAAYREHLSWLSQYDVAGLFAAGGTGEGFSLTPAEIDAVVRTAVSEVNGRVPVIAPATGGTASAIEGV